MIVLAWFQITVGVALAGLWGMLLATRQVPQITAGNRDIWFHLTAEAVTAAALIAGGVHLLASATGTATVLSGVALGALLYTTINSAGYYADRGDWSVVAMFAALALATAVAVAGLLTTLG